MLVEAFVSEPAVETLDEPVLLWLSRCDIVPRAVVTDDHQWPTAMLSNPVEFADRAVRLTTTYLPSALFI
ncbi:hypothetical protein B932_0945 [Gluconobacter oxydans H24]|nr:hypothetical protein B932_0945 [Gluconobacter oxydans H24]